MPRKINKAAPSAQSAQPQISAQLLEELIPGPVTKEQFEDIFQNFKRAFIERALNAEMSHHLGYTSGQVKPEGATNHRKEANKNNHREEASNKNSEEEVKMMLLGELINS